MAKRQQLVNNGIPIYPQTDLESIMVSDNMYLVDTLIDNYDTDVAAGEDIPVSINTNFVYYGSDNTIQAPEYKLIIQPDHVIDAIGITDNKDNTYIDDIEYSSYIGVQCVSSLYGSGSFEPVIVIDKADIAPHHSSTNDYDYDDIVPIETYAINYTSGSSNTSYVIGFDKSKISAGGGGNYVEQNYDPYTSGNTSLPTENVYLINPYSSYSYYNGDGTFNTWLTATTSSDSDDTTWLTNYNIMFTGDYVSYYTSGINSFNVYINDNECSSYFEYKNIESTGDYILHADFIPLNTYYAQ